jgi:hypothetical protein
MTSSGSLVAMSPKRPMMASPARRSGAQSPSAASRDPQALLPHRLPQPDPLEGRLLPWSQIHGLSTNVLVSWLERAPRDNVHPDAQEFLEVLEQADVIKKRRTWLEVHEQIHVAVRAGLSPGDGAEHGDPMSPALPRDTEDLGAAAAESLECQRFIGHALSVSPRTSTTLEPGTTG